MTKRLMLALLCAATLLTAQDKPSAKKLLDARFEKFSSMGRWKNWW